MSQEKRLSRAKQLLEKLGLGDKWQNKPNQLSGGQQQRVSIARALMNGEIILADEPTGALDSQSGQNVMEILRQLHAEGHTIIMVTHDRKLLPVRIAWLKLKTAKSLVIRKRSSKKCGRKSNQI